MNYNSNYFTRLLQGFSQFGHALSGGSPDISISARTGFESKHFIYWKWLRLLIDFAFEPLDGKNHCEKAYMADIQENYMMGRYIITPVICTSLALPICLILIVLTLPLRIFNG